MAKFRKKPVVIEARIYDGDGQDVVRWAANISDGNGTELLWSSEDGLFVRTLEGMMKVSVGDWIICGVNGEFYPCKPDIFEKTYELVE